MIAQILADKCNNCAQCVSVCPTFVLDDGPQVPVIARLDACQTCYMCELYCDRQAIYVAPDQFAPEPETDPTPHLGVIRRDHGWDRPGETSHLDEYRKLGPLLGEGAEIAARRYQAQRRGV